MEEAVDFSTLEAQEQGLEILGEPEQQVHSAGDVPLDVWWQEGVFVAVVRMLVVRKLVVQRLVVRMLAVRKLAVHTTADCMPECACLPLACFSALDEIHCLVVILEGRRP